MRTHKFFLIAVSALLLLLCESAFGHGRGGQWGGGGHWRHHHSGARVGVFIGVPLAAPYYPYYYRPPYYGYAPVITVPAAPTSYVEQSRAGVTSSSDANSANNTTNTPPQTNVNAGNWWYFCRNPQGYYPYVRECQQGWQQVAPKPPDLR
jgi:hypothetical protein